MEDDDRHLDSLTSSMIEYFNEVLIHKNCVSSTFRKYSVKNDEDVEFVFLRLKSTCDDKKSFYQTDSSCLTEEEAKKLIKISESWRLHLADVSLVGNKLCLKLNRPHAFFTVVNSILTRKSDYGKCFSQKQPRSWFYFKRGVQHQQNETVKITSDEIETEDLTAYRLSLLKTAAENLLKMGGYELKDEEQNCWLHITKNSTQESETGAKLKVLCGPVVNSKTKSKETRITSEEYRKLRLRDVEIMSEGKNYDEQVLNSLVDACITISLLQVKSSQAVSINLNPDSTGARELGSKGGAFLQYNASRLAAIRKKHCQLVQQRIYLEVPKPEDVDFGLLREPEEWALLFNFLLEYPSLIEKVAKDMAAGKSNVHQICEFLLKLCSLFSVYYRRVRILLEPRNHLFKTIHARLLLLRSVEQVLENGFAIFNINKIEQM